MADVRIGVEGWRNGRVVFRGAGDAPFGPYKLSVRRDFLRKLLEAQARVRVCHDRKCQAGPPD